MKTLYVEKSRAGQTIRTETMDTREKMVNTKNQGHEANYTNLSSGGMSDLSASITSGKVKRPGGGS